MKALHRYIIKSFLGPLALTLVIALFILLMQFLWKYIDDLVGKGLSGLVITKFMIWVMLYLIPLALPMAILLASIMTFGNLAENYELVALKSSGLSLPRIMTPLATLVLAISIGAFLFANYGLPVINLKMNSLLWDIQNTKPALNLQPDVFYSGINGYSMRIGAKDPDQETVHNILIYDHTSNMGNTKVVLAKSGKIKMSTDSRYMIFTLDDGNSYEDMMDNNQERISHPILENHFTQQTLYLDLSSFRFSRTKEELFKSDYQMMDMRQLSNSADSLKKSLNKSKEQFSKQIITSYLSVETYPRRNLRPRGLSNLQDKMMLLDAATNTVRSAKEMIGETSTQFDASHLSVIQRELQWQRTFTFPFACLLLFFIGAPLGAIIRKGGLGMPVVVAAIFFVLYYILTIVGTKSARQEEMTVFTGSWLSAIILTPIGVFLTYKASVDSAIFDRDAYLNFFKKVRVFLKMQKA
ncbi:MAG TPA: LptF/LptG family permease [Bacteroidia bacterium]|nr:LptF/LptG family permease [Bacteroidia bacterium]